MGNIISSKINKDKIVYEIALTPDEALQLKGHVNNIYLFTENVAEIRTNISQRGKNAATKYFLIPRELRKGLDFRSSVSCQKFETKEKTIFIYVLDKFTFNGK
ncbi:MAG: hypothetical protein KAT77_05450 [Nanoarchaeota archaeon]|nr:hypothetical protein [Nanoarchaeota archaeon]